eukprot:750372-Hanusia_phi.AAC.3
MAKNYWNCLAWTVLLALAAREARHLTGHHLVVLPEIAHRNRQGNPFLLRLRGGMFHMVDRHEFLESDEAELVAEFDAIATYGLRSNFTILKYKEKAREERKMKLRIFETNRILETLSEQTAREVAGRIRF